MHETPAAFNASVPLQSGHYPADNLAGFRWHTGATPRAISPEEACPVLFRDIGPAALALFLRDRLPRLSGPLSPLIYMRTADYVEPYTDYERTGRLLILRPLLLHPWHSGTPSVYVARARSSVDAAMVGFVPGDVPLSEAARRAESLTSICQWRESLGGRCYDEVVAESLYALDQLAAELAASEDLAAPLRDSLQSRDRDVRQRTRDQLERVGLTEMDLCTAWHHLPHPRRDWIAETLRRMEVHRES